MRRELETIIAQLGELMREYNEATAVVLLIIGLPVLLLGLRLVNFIVALPGMLIGGVLGYLTFAEIGAVIGALVLGLLFFVLYRFGIWVVGALAGFVLSLWLAQHYGWTSNWIWLLYVFAAIWGGGIALALHDLFTIVTTSASGSLLVAYAITGLLAIAQGGAGIPYGFSRWIGNIAQGLSRHGIEGAFRYQAFELTLIAALFIIGVLFQYHSRFSARKAETDDAGGHAADREDAKRQEPGDRHQPRRG
jgi:hypothetical protein